MRQFENNKKSHNNSEIRRIKPKWYMCNTQMAHLFDPPLNDIIGTSVAPSLSPASGPFAAHPNTFASASPTLLSATPTFDCVPPTYPGAVHV